MRRLLLVIPIIFAAGCSNAPIAGTLDCFNHKSGDKRTDTPRTPAPPDRPPASDLPPIAPPNG